MVIDMLNRRKRARRRRAALEMLECRRVLAASVGWDGPGLGSAELTYYIGNSPDSLSQAETDAAIESALDAWAAVVDITFTEVSTPGLQDSLDITFTNIDGTAGTLAQAYFPDDINPGSDRRRHSVRYCGRLGSWQQPWQPSL